MSDEHEPPPPPELAELLRGMRADTLTPDEVARLAQRLGPMLGGGGGGAAAAPPRTVSGTALAAVGGSVVIGAAIAIYFASAAPMQETATRAPAAPVAALDREAPPDEDVVVDHPSEISRVIEASDRPAPDARAASEAPAEPIGRARTAEPRASEHTLLVDARRALDTDPARALGLADRHRREFPDGALAPEREMIAVDALSALGRAPAARRRAERLAARWPGSTYAERVRARGLLD